MTIRIAQEDADKAVSLLADGTYRKVDATHVVHLSKPDLYIDCLHDFFLHRGKNFELDATPHRATS